MTEDLAARVRETHVAVVLLFGDRAYKLKKPVDMGFLDFRTRESRHAACLREVELNRRFAPDVYLGVSEVSDVDGQVCDHLVVMRRMPERGRLSGMVRAGAELSDTISSLARTMAVHHSTAPRSPEISAQGTRDAIGQRWQQSFAQVAELGDAPVNAEALAEIQLLASEFLAGRKPLFDARIAAGRVVDGHGDLLADDIFVLDDGPRVLDCLEFDDGLRWLDGLDDVAFLAMDLERLGAPDLAGLLLDRYAEFSGDPAPASLREHYVAYRAFVRAKIACLRHTQGKPEAAEEARTHADIALSRLRQGQVRLVLVGGLPGTGKTTVGGLLADKLGAVLLSSDRLRKELAGMSPGDHASASYLDGIYTPSRTDAVYAELLHRAEKLLAQGESVVLDASWTDAGHRDSAAGVSHRSYCPLVQLRCEAPAAIAAARIRGRAGSISDADPAVAAAMSAAADTWKDAITVRTTGTPNEALERILDELIPTSTAPGRPATGSVGAAERPAAGRMLLTREYPDRCG